MGCWIEDPTGKKIWGDVEAASAWKLYGVCRGEIEPLVLFSWTKFLAL
jgi:hypothetical protein